MSIVLKSNVVSENNLGTYKSLISNATTELAAYKARVLADGGEIIDEAETLSAFHFLINQGIYGIARTFIGAKYGMKRNASGHITKLYSLDGEDLVAFNLGVGSPVTLINGEISFSNTIMSNPSEQTKGTIFITQSKIKAHGRGLVVGVSGSRLSNASAEMGISAFTLLDNVVNSSPLWLLTLSGGITYIVAIRQTGETPNQNSIQSTTRLQSQLATTGNKYTFFADHKNKLFKGYRNGAMSTLPTATNQFSNLEGFDGYISFGGYIINQASDKRYIFGNFAANRFFMYDDLPQKQVEALAKF